jgi:hypothetical protein
MKRFRYGHGWAPEKKGIGKRAQEAGIEFVYDTMYTLGCNASHSNAHSVTQTIHQSMIWFGPRVPDNDFVLEMASKAFLMLVERVVDLFGTSRGLLAAFIAEHQSTFVAPV